MNMDRKPLFSIVIANYNYGRFLEDAIKSVIAQGMGDKVELIVCDAASTDNSVEIIKKYANGLPPNISYTDWINSSNHNSQTPPLITWWCSEKDGGQSAAFNKGFSHAKGRFLTWLNADDVLLPGALAAVAKEIQEHPEDEWFVGSMVKYDAEMKLTQYFRAHRFSTIRAKWVFLSAGGPSSFFTKRLLDAVGGVDESLHLMMDIDLWYKFYRQGNVKYRRTTRPVWGFRVHPESKMSGKEVDTDIERKNRAIQKSREERMKMWSRYSLNTASFKSKIATVISLSIIDKLVDIWVTWRYKGTRWPQEFLK